MASRFTLLILIAWSFGGLPKQASAADPSLKAYQTYALTHAGNAERGAELYRAAQRTKCATCHQVNGEGGKVGPDLSSIGNKFDRPHLIESLLEPSRQIVEGYRTSSVLTSDGRVLAGILKEQADGKLLLQDAEAKTYEFHPDEIEQVSQQPVSLMPSGLAETLSTQEFADLIAYLETLRPGGKHGAGSDISGPITIPTGFELTTLATGLTGATAMQVMPDGRLLICEQTGQVRIFRDGELLPQPLISLPVDHAWERGVIGITIDPDFENTPWVYICWTAKDPYPHHRISRFLMDGDRAIPESEELLLVGDDQTKMGGNVPAGHQGGGLHFGSDGNLYIGIGEQTAGSPAQQLDTFLGKMLRIHADGSIPEDNPLLDRTRGKYRAIWTYGMRNPFTFAVRPSDGLILINDVGGKFEEINVGLPGKNYGWPVIEHGRANSDEYEDPIHWYPEASISGGDFLPADSGWPEEYAGRYFFADFKHGWIHTIDPDQRDKLTDEQGIRAGEFASGIRRPVDLRFDQRPNEPARMLILLRNAWVIDDKFQTGTSSLLAIQPLRRD
ncbi:MAG: PQQ-dependent sugar dehydrogenase [bacterium]|nr:PQQ-dependent sugar dehydrogenase [bacterium]